MAILMPSPPDDVPIPVACSKISKRRVRALAVGECRWCGAAAACGLADDLAAVAQVSGVRLMDSGACARRRVHHLD